MTNALEQKLEDYLNTDEAWEDLRSPGDEGGGYTVIAREAGDSRRWNQAITIVVKDEEGNHFSYWYDEGLTEYQPDEYYGGTVKQVKRVEKMVPVVTWEPVDA